MKNTKFKYTKILISSLLLLVISMGCERELSDRAELATFPTVAGIFTDNPVGLGSDFYFPYGGSKPTAWSVDSKESYQGTASMRFDVPNADDPEGNYAGAIFRVDGEGTGRDLTGYDALTFWAKASQVVTIGEIGFGEDFGANKYITTRNGVKLTTNWQKYIIPIPDASKLVQERGVLRYSAGGIGPVGNEVGFTFWMDEVGFEKLGTLAQPKPAIFNGVDEAQQIVVNSAVSISGLTQTFNAANGRNITVAAAPSYFNFSSSNIEVARVSELGVITVIGDGTAKITATLAGVVAAGSLTLTASSITPAPVPTVNAADVISLFSDAYTNIAGVVPDANYGGQTTQSSELNIGGDAIISYTNLNYVGFEFQNPTVNATDYNFLHVDIYTTSTNTNFNIEVRDRGVNGIIDTNIFTGAPSVDDKRLVYTMPAASIVQGEWISLEIPLTGDLANQKNNLAALIFSGDIDFLLDNVYLYK